MVRLCSGCRFIHNIHRQFFIFFSIINRSINQTLSRTLLTSLTTLLAVTILYVIGGQGIHAFAYALLVGVIVGTYSSIFVASPALLWLMNTVGLNPGEVDEGKLADA